MNMVPVIYLGLPGEYSMVRTNGTASGVLEILFHFKHFWPIAYDDDLTVTVFTCSKQL